MAKIKGNSGDNLLNGTSGDDKIDGKSGNDTIFGMTGNDDIKGGSGDDTLFGDPGNDTLDGGSGEDSLDGGTGDDELDGGSGHDTLSGGDGEDTLDGGAGDDVLDGGADNDTIDAGSGDDDIMGGAGNDEIDAGSGDDTIEGGAGDDTIDGHSGDDVVVYSGSVADFVISISGDTLTVADQTGAEGTDTLENIEVIQFDDFVFDVEGDTNNAPVALVSDQSVSENDDLSVDLSVVDFDGDAVNLPVVSVTSDNSTTTPGTITIVGPGSPDAGYTGVGLATTFNLQYTPGDGYQFLNTGETVTETVTITSTDEFGATFTQTFDIVITGTNNAPVANDDTATTDEDTAVNINVLGNDTDVDNTAAELSVVTADALNGTVVVEADGTLTYTPDEDFNGTDTITYTMTDGQETSTASVTVTVNPVNDAPVANDDTATINEDSTVNIDVLGNDTDVDNTAAELSVLTADAPNGTVVVEADGTLTYTPDDDFNGTDTITYTITDGDETSTGTVTVTVNPVNDAPVANDDTASVDEDGSVNIDVLGNDTDIDNTAAELSVVTADALNGTVVVEADGTLTYTPDDDFNGTDTITYTITDGDKTSTASVTVTVNPVNDAPVANDDSATVDEDGSVNIDVLANDTDIDNTAAELSVTTADAPNGTVVIEEDGTLTYTPDDDFNGTDTITYTITDGDKTSTATVTVTVNPLPDDPIAVEDDAETTPDTAVNIDVLANDQNPDNVPGGLTVTVAVADNGVVVIEADGTLTYTPNGGFTGTDLITYTIEDGNGATATSTVSVTVQEESIGNTAPTALTTTIAATLLEEEGATNILEIDFNTLTAGGQPIISDAEQSLAELSVTAIELVVDGRIITQIIPTGTNIFELDLDALNVADGATATFEITNTVDDGQGGTTSNTITLEVTNPTDEVTNTPPIATDDTITQTEDDGNIVISILGEGGLASDPDAGDVLTVTSFVITDAEGNPIDIDLGGEEEGDGPLVDGVLTLDPFVFGLGDGETGTFLVTYTVSDGQASATGTVTLNLTGSGTNSAPIALTATEVLQDPDDVVPFLNAYQIDLNPLVSDPYGDPVTIAVTSIEDVDGNALTFTFLDGVITISLFSLESDLGLVAGGTENLVITYTADDGINPAVTSTVDLTVIAPPEEPTGPETTILDFENISVEEGFAATLESLGGLGFDGTAQVIEVDEAIALDPSRVATGLVTGQTTDGGGTVATIQGTFNGFDDNDQPTYAFTALASGATTQIGGPDVFVNTFFQSPEDFFGNAFDLESMSLTALDGPDIVVTIITYRYEEVSPNSFNYVEVGSFDVTVSSTTALDLDFFAGQFVDTDTFVFDDPETTEVETSAFDNIVAIQFVTTGVLVPTNPDDPNTDVQPINDDVLVIDDLVFTF
ncbi:Ig-like domain-containing protein [Tateyamaria sp.]|uniref:Ig-like domain-containing protein n=1 Tax=Tateyamaria sp. TaxID=1929288 RepID=UPI003B212BD7